MRACLSLEVQSEFVSAPIASPTRLRATTLQASASLSIIEPDANGDGAYESLYLPLGPMQPVATAWAHCSELQIQVLEPHGGQD
jgi:hypothetical protein